MIPPMDFEDWGVPDTPFTEEDARRMVERARILGEAAAKDTYERIWKPNLGSSEDDD